MPDPIVVILSLIIAGCVVGVIAICVAMLRRGGKSE